MHQLFINILVSLSQLLSRNMHLKRFSEMKRSLLFVSDNCGKQLCKYDIRKQTEEGPQVFGTQRHETTAVTVTTP